MMGLERGRAASTIFYHPKSHVRVVVHGDDFTVGHRVRVEEDTIEGVRVVWAFLAAENVRRVRCRSW